jgi:hypothetical protein
MRGSRPRCSSRAATSCTTSDMTTTTSLAARGSWP